eukprot:15336177-Alexandrium_andersonii.AAC.1
MPSDGLLRSTPGQFARGPDGKGCPSSVRRCRSASTALASNWSCLRRTRCLGPSCSGSPSMP